MPKLYIKNHAGLFEPARRETIGEAAAKYLTPLKGQKITSPTQTETFLINKLAHREAETFCCIFLDNRHYVLAFDESFQGTVDGTAVYPREIAKRALLLNAAAVILAHNHPSGVAEPSQADERITKRVKAGLELLDIRLLDHLIIGGKNATSLAARGLL